MSQAIFRISRDGQPLPQWNPYSSLGLTSRSGLVVYPRYQSWGRRDGNLVLNFEGTLDPAQGPWKLRLELIHETDFSSNELVSLPGVALPAAGLTNQIGLQTNFLGKTILVERANGASNVPPASVSGHFGQQPFLEVFSQPEVEFDLASPSRQGRGRSRHQPELQRLSRNAKRANSTSPFRPIRIPICSI